MIIHIALASYGTIICTIAPIIMERTYAMPVFSNTTSEYDLVLYVVVYTSGGHSLAVRSVAQFLDSSIL